MRSVPAHRPVARLNVAMRCDTAFRIIARRHLAGLDANRQATCEGNPEALHQMRMALTHLRASIRFFSPMVDDSTCAQIRHELKWLNAELGPPRDLDVMIERIEATKPGDPQSIPGFRAWQQRQSSSRRQLARALQSARYRRLIERAIRWVEGGPWSIARGKQAMARRATPLGSYGADRLENWEKKLLKKRAMLRKMTPGARHRLRLLNKRISYSIESLSELLDDKRFSGQKAAVKPLRKAREALGRLNDEVRSRACALELRRDGIDVPLHFLDCSERRRLLRKAEAAYRKLSKLKPWK